MRQRLPLFLFSVLIIATAGCARLCVVATHYNKKENTTVFNRVRYCKVSLPGKWYLGRYDKKRRGYFLTNAGRCVTVEIAINPSKSYNFYKEGMTANAFADSFYMGDVKDTTIGNNKPHIIIQNDTLNHTILSCFYARRDDIYALYSIDKGNAFSYLISSPKWDSTQKVDFLLKEIKRKCK